MSDSGAAPGGPPLLLASGVTVRLGGKAVVDDVSLPVRPGRLLALVGPNGAGKSTLLACLSGDRAPDAGSVTLDGVDIGAIGARDLARQRAVLPQQTTVSFGFTVEDVVRMGRAPWRGTLASDDDDAEVSDALRRTDVAHLVSRTFPTLSGGERARAALARVLAQATPILMLDEPTAALDLGHQELVLSLARDHARGGGSTVVVLHDLTLTAAYADDVAILHEGSLAALGPPQEVFRPALLTEVWRHPIDVFPHPTSAHPLILPRR